jgi:hypothetical protein
VQSSKGKSWKEGTEEIPTIPYPPTYLPWYLSTFPSSNNHNQASVSAVDTEMSEATHAAL